MIVVLPPVDTGRRGSAGQQWVFTVFEAPTGSRIKYRQGALLSATPPYRYDHAYVVGAASAGNCRPVWSMV